MSTVCVLPRCAERRTVFEFAPSTFKSKSGALFYDLVPARVVLERLPIPCKNEKAEGTGTR